MKGDTLFLMGEVEDEEEKEMPLKRADIGDVLAKREELREEKREAKLALKRALKQRGMDDDEREGEVE